MTHSLFERHLVALIGPCSPDESPRLKRLTEKFLPHFDLISSHLYAHLPDTDRERFLIWFAKRWAAIDRVPQEEADAYAEEVARIRTYPCAAHTDRETTYKILSLEPQGYRGALVTYPWMLGIHDLLFNQYEHGDFRIRKGDTIIDAGAFVGDTALLFHQLSAGQCSIHAFEVLDENLALLAHNLATNGISDQVTICAFALRETLIYSEAIAPQHRCV